MCTSILSEYPGGAVLGRNMDYDVPLNYNILYFPRNYIYAEDLEGNSLKTKYSMLGACFNDYNPLKDGINEMGLCGCTNLLIGMDRYSDRTEEGKINISALDYFSYALASYKDVDELLRDLPNIHISTKDSDGRKVICPDFHYYFLDKKGRTVVIEPEDKKFKAFENPCNVMTNSPEFEKHVEKLKSLQNSRKKINPARNLPGGFDPVSRFIRAYYLKPTHSPDGNTAMEGLFSSLEALKLPESFAKTERDDIYTRYTAAYSPVDGVMAIRTHRNPKVYSFRIEDFKGVTERKSVFLPQEFMTEPFFR